MTPVATPFFHLLVRSFDEPEIVNPAKVESDAIRRYSVLPAFRWDKDGRNGMMHIANFETGALPRETAGPSADTRRLCVSSESGLV